MDEGGGGPADLVLTGGPVWSGAGVPTGVDRAVAMRDGRILAVGGDREVRALSGAGSRIVDVEGGLILPGFIDAHTHFLAGGFRLSAVQLRDACSPAEFTARLAARAAASREGEWILGGDWDHERWGGELPDRRWIDEVTPANPVFVHRLDGHMALANTRALERGGVDGASRSPEGGLIVRDADGRPTGILKDRAMRLVSQRIPPPTDEARDDALRAALRHAASVGITGVHDMGLGDWSHVETCRRAEAAGELTVRVTAYVPLTDWEELTERLAAPGVGDGPWFRLGGLKAFLDGSLGSGTALFEEPYGDPATRGLVVAPPEELRPLVEAADAEGLQVAVHAIGDRANRLLLDLFSAVADAHGPRDRRFRIEHAQHLRAEDIPRFRALGVIPSMQPAHAIDDGRWAEARIGRERCERAYAFRSLLDAGARPAFGSDWAIAPLDPLLGIYGAVERRPGAGRPPLGPPAAPPWVPAERLRLEEALTAHTRDAARAAFQEDRLGTLEPGKAADVVVLDRDPRKGDAEDLRTCGVRMTVAGGRVVFEA
ncbi:MAG: amidohydrolase [Gemmatimonadota bacterium]